ncbi:hypothetical protein HFP15_21305 [Amycolatopsis sp. K13G38]|uniref:Uncharacterized protein n=1 Tax=Amycolatopsis acididurans TaxID=2724524 RepID=A0ABX1J6I2_9PSEU|nr:hypothetical protein [Amycolatopsis acididurans]NKQ55425.1 hypothetical protein [Amycolatopsis acididurans]
MLTFTPPLVTSPDEAWVFIASETGAVDVGRVAYSPSTDRFAVLPVEAFNPDTLLPTYTPTGQLVDGFRWATTADIDANADLFTA